ncbi:MAG: hypothetical protein XU14_C0025G0034 [Armatimonadetes bacterium CSP1-3]|nr:MAG: hypothetical protein XU14_C0025G0034 [Armatimonadetes bacterium CSP1-3]
MKPPTASRRALQERRVALAQARNPMAGNVMIGASG